MHTSLPPNRQIKERHKETQPRRQLQKRIRSGRKNEECTVPGVSAVKPQNQREILQKSQSLAAEAKYPRQTWRADVNSPAQRAQSWGNCRQPLTCSRRDS